mgnify:FL=1
MDRNIWETIANQCAPVLMDVKPSNLLILTRAEEAAFRQMDEIEGISCICLHSGKKSTWFLYRKDRLEAALIWPQVREFLETYGYGSLSFEEMLTRMARRYTLYKEKQADFPHELGIFLGYPLGDVKGFIKHQGKNFLCSGYWKVYQNENRAQETFQLYRAVRDVMLKMLSAGRSLYEISSYAV